MEIGVVPSVPTCSYLVPTSPTRAKCLELRGCSHRSVSNSVSPNGYILSPFSLFGRNRRNRRNTGEFVGEFLFLLRSYLVAWWEQASALPFPRVPGLVEAIGGAAKAAAALGVNKAFVYHWLKGTRPTPPEHLRRLRELTTPTEPTPVVLRPMRFVAREVSDE